MVLSKTVLLLTKSVVLLLTFLLGEPTTCLQCNQCAFVCPHACIRPFLLTEEEANNAPATVKMADGKGKEAGYKYVMQVSVMDCTGCGNCVASCPMAAKENAPIKMIAFDDEAAKQAEAWDYTIALPSKANPEDKFTVKVLSSNSLYLNSQVLVVVVLKLLMLDLLLSYSVIECTLQTQQVVLQSGVVLLLQLLTLLTLKVMVQLGVTHSSKITLNLV